MGSSSTHEAPPPRIMDLGNGFYNIRTSFKIFKGILDIGTHMSLIRLQSGGFVAFDTVPLDPELKQEIDNLTDQGRNLIAVVATHPFHTLAFPAFYSAYPNPIYIGTPRHVKTVKGIPWNSADVTSSEIQKRWSPEIEMRIPAGSEFNAPLPESSNHFNSLWVFHLASRTIHIDDTVMYFENPGKILKLAGKKNDLMEFHMSMAGPGLYSAPDAPGLFKSWAQSVLVDWDFDNMCCAHIGRKIGGAKEALRVALQNAEPIFKKLEKKYEHNMSVSEMEEVSATECAEYNVDGHECG